MNRSGGVQPPRAPLVSQAPPLPLSKKAPEPPESGWDEESNVETDADTIELSSSAVVPAADDVRPPPVPGVARPHMQSVHEAPTARRARSSPDLLPEVSMAPRVPEPPRTPQPVQRSRAPEPTARDRSEPRPPAHTEPGAFGLNSFPIDVQEQLFGVLRAALEESLSPLLAKQTELENRLEALREAEDRGAIVAAARLTQPRRSVSPPTEVKVQLATASLRPQSSGAPSVRPSVVSTSYGLVIEQPGGSRRPAIEVALANVGPVDVPDFGSSRRAAGRVLLALLLAGVAAAVVATILSYT